MSDQAEHTYVSEPDSPTTVILLGGFLMLVASTLVAVVLTGTVETAVPFWLLCGFVAGVGGLALVMVGATAHGVLLASRITAAREHRQGR